jgi:hypothetical protein
VKKRGGSVFKMPRIGVRRGFPLRGSPAFASSIRRCIVIMYLQRIRCEADDWEEELSVARQSQEQREKEVHRYR